jgi:hypothetical protein
MAVSRERVCGRGRCRQRGAKPHERRTSCRSVPAFGSGVGETLELAKRLGVGVLEGARGKALYSVSEVQPKLMVAAEQPLWLRGTASI